jgi:hypothetical protein
MGEETKRTKSIIERDNYRPFASQACAVVCRLGTRAGLAYRMSTGRARGRHAASDASAPSLTGEAPKADGQSSGRSGLCTTATAQPLEPRSSAVSLARLGRWVMTLHHPLCRSWAILCVIGSADTLQPPADATGCAQCRAGRADDAKRRQRRAAGPTILELAERLSRDRRTGSRPCMWLAIDSEAVVRSPSRVCCRVAANGPKCKIRRSLLGVLSSGMPVTVQSSGRRCRTEPDQLDSSSLRMNTRRKPLSSRRSNSR